jgi:hypothetical protein
MVVSMAEDAPSGGGGGGPPQGGPIDRVRRYRIILAVVLSIILGVCLAIAAFWVYAVVTRGKNF